MATGEKFDVIFINRPQTFEQALRDFTNSLAVLDEGGVIVIDGVSPDSFGASVKRIEDAAMTTERLAPDDRSWTGDVYRLVYFIDAFFPSCTYRSVEENPGLLVVWPEKREPSRLDSVGGVARKSYSDVSLDRFIFNGALFPEVLEEVKQHVATRRKTNASSLMIAVRSERRSVATSAVRIAPHVVQLNDVCLTPFSLLNHIFYGGVEEGVSCPYAALSETSKRDVQLRRPASVRRQRGRSLYAGILWNHFGHMLTEGLHRLWAFDPSKHSAIVFNCVFEVREPVPQHLRRDYWRPWGQTTFPDFVKELMALMGIEAPVFLLREPTVFDALDVPEAGSVLSEGVKPFYLEHLQRFQDIIEAAVAGFDVPEKIYFSRRHIMASRGGVLGVSYFESLLSKNGFQIVRPERQPLLQQFANVTKAGEIAFDDGSSVHSTDLLARLRPKFHMFPRRAHVSGCVPALKTRAADLTMLSSLENVGHLPDLRGDYTSAGVIGFYKNLSEVVRMLERIGVDVSGFDESEFAQMEEEEIRTAVVEDPAVIATRLAIIREHRRRG